MRIRLLFATKGYRGFYIPLYPEVLPNLKSYKDTIFLRDPLHLRAGAGSRMDRFVSNLDPVMRAGN